MWRNGVACIGWLLCSWQAFGQFVQEYEERADYWSLAASVNISSPIEDHGDISASNAHSGYAKPGIGAQLEGGFMSRLDLGVYARAFYNYNPLNRGAYEDDLSRFLGGLGTVSQTYTGDYNEYGIMIGPRLRKRITRDFEIMVDFGFGWANSVLPQIGYSYVDSSNVKYDIFISRDEVSGQLWSVGAGAHYFVTERIGFRAHIQYLKGKFRHQGIPVSREASTGASDRISIDLEKRLTLVNIGLGVVLSF